MMKCPGWLKRILRAMLQAAKKKAVEEAIKGVVKEDNGTDE
jgi:hypothetical protein